MQDIEALWIWSLGQEDPLEEGNNPLHYSWVENQTDRGAWQATAHSVPKSQARLKRLTRGSRNSTEKEIKNINSNYHF